MKPIIKHCTSCCLALAMATALLATLASCSKEEATDDTLPPGKYPINFTATMQGLTVQKAASRATTVNIWDGNEEVAVKIDSKVKKYTAAADGALTVATGVTPWYWQNTTEQKTVSAWYPHSAAQPTTFTVQTDQSGGGYQSSDLIYATPTIISFGSNALTFKHLPAKVVVNLKADTQNGVTEDEVTNATVTIVNQTTTSGTIAADWSVAQTAPGNSIITPNMLTTTANGYQQSVQALLVPQQITASTKFIKVTIGLQEFYYSTTLNFTAGQQHTYNIMVLKSGLSVTASGATAWTGTTSGVISKEIVAGYTPSDLKIGDYYYSDGTTGDGGYRKYTDKTTATLPVMPVLTDANNQPRTVVGIVYWLGDPTNTTNGDQLLKTNHPGCTHGLVVALHDAKQPSAPAAAEMKWSNSYEQVNDWTNHSDRSENKVNITEENRYQGYANTVALKAYNAQQSNANLKVLPIAAIEQYNTDYPAPSNSSGWYVPSILELKYICWGQGNGKSTAGRDLLNGQFAKVGGTNFDGSWGYWSSSEYAGDGSRAWYVNFSSGSVNGYGKGGNEFWVRALLAF